MYLVLVYFHVLFVTFFTVYILIDRIFVRNFFQKNKREQFYEKAKFPLLFNSLFISSTGLYLLFQTPLTVIICLKLFTVVFLFYGFLNCPFYMKKQKCKIRRFMYRFGVLILLLIGIILGIHI